MKRYSIRIFDNKLNFKSYKEIEKVSNLVFDYLSLEKTKLTFRGQLPVSKGDYVSLCENEEEIFQGIVCELSFDKHTTSIMIMPFQSLFDVPIYTHAVDQVNDGTLSLERFFMAEFRKVYETDDTFFNLRGLTEDIHSETYGTIEADDKFQYNLYDIASKYLRIYGLVIGFKFNPMNKTLTISFNTSNTSSYMVIDTAEPDVLDYRMQTTSDKSANKILYINSDDDTETATFYWHPEGFEGYVNQSPSEPRMLPVSLKIVEKKAIEEKKDKDGNVTQEAKSFIEVCEEDAYDSMYRTSFDDTIEMTVRSNSKVIIIGEIGSRYVILFDDAEYYTMLTATEYIDDSTVRVTFGMARTSLTQIVRKNARYVNGR